MGVSQRLLALCFSFIYHAIHFCTDSTPSKLSCDHLSFSCTGGCNERGLPIKKAEVFNFETRKWSTLPKMPTPRAAASGGAVVRDNQIIVVGGVTTQQVPLDKVDCFDIAKNQWVDFPSLPIGVVGPFVALIDDKLYCIAGTDKKDCNQSVVFDFDKKEWLNLPTKPSPCYSCGGYIFDRKIFIIGGRHGTSPVQDVEAFDLETQQWEKLAPMNAVRVFYSIVGIEDQIYVMGGLVPTIGVTKVVERYNIHEDMWSRIKDLTELRSDCAGGVVGNRVVVATGLGGAPDKPSVMDTAECIEYNGKKFKKLPGLSLGRSSVTTICFDGKMAVVNGVGEGGPQPVVEIIQVKEEKDKNI